LGTPIYNLEDAQAQTLGEQSGSARTRSLAAVAAEPEVEIAYGEPPEGIDPEDLVPDHAGAMLREAQLSGALDTIRKAIETNRTPPPPSRSADRKRTSCFHGQGLHSSSKLRELLGDKPAGNGYHDSSAPQPLLA
jgi:hypothetical protein